MFFGALLLAAALVAEAAEPSNVTLATGTNMTEYLQQYEVALTGNVVTYSLELTEGYSQLDGFRIQVPLINGQFPGPTIHCKPGDTLVINITNNMESGRAATIHLHGLDDFLGPQMDGVAFVTQFPLQYGKSYTQRQYVTNDPGTYWYHAHYMLQSQSIFGALVIDEPVTVSGAVNSTTVGAYDGDFEVLLSDWFHQTDQAMMAGLMATPFVWIGDPQSILINGKGAYNCSSKPNLLTTNGVKQQQCYQQSAQSQERFTVSRGKTYRFRIIGASTLSYFRFEVASHTMTIIEADGLPTAPYNVDHLEVNSGQRYSVLITANSELKQSAFLMTVSCAWRMNGPIGYAIMQYAPDNSTMYVQSLDALFPNITQNLRQTGNPPAQSNWIFDQLKPSAEQLKTRDSSEYLDKPTKTVHLTSRQQKVPVPNSNQSMVMWQTNDAGFHLNKLDVPLLHAAYKGREFLRTTMLKAVTGSHDDGRPMTKDDMLAQTVYEIEVGDVVRIVLQDTVALNGVCEQHPWHLHAYKFFEIGGGPGNYTELEQSGKLSQYMNFKDPLQRDTTTVYPYSSAYFQQGANGSSPGVPGSACGWRAIQFSVDNPGLWPFHCHISSHMSMGMLIVFVDSYDRLMQMKPIVELDNSDATLYWANATESLSSTPFTNDTASQIDNSTSDTPLYPVVFGRPNKYEYDYTTDEKSNDAVQSGVGWLAVLATILVLFQ